MTTFLGLVSGGVAVMLLMAPLFVHESAHWAALQHFGYGTRGVNIGIGPVVMRWGRVQVRLVPVAGALDPEIGDMDKIPWRQRAVIALAGPLASSALSALLLIGALPYANVGPAAPGAHGLSLIALLSLFMAMLNLLPLPGLDGWVALRALMQGAGLRVPANSGRFGTGYYLLLMGTATALFVGFSHFTFDIG